MFGFGYENIKFVVTDGIVRFQPLLVSASSASPKAVRSGGKLISTFFRPHKPTHSKQPSTAKMNGPLSTYGGGGAGGSAEMGDAQTMAAGEKCAFFFSLCRPLLQGPQRSGGFKIQD